MMMVLACSVFLCIDKEHGVMCGDFNPLMYWLEPNALNSRFDCEDFLLTVGVGSQNNSK